MDIDAQLLNHERRLKELEGANLQTKTDGLAEQIAKLSGELKALWTSLPPASAPPSSAENAAPEQQQG